MSLRFIYGKSGTGKTTFCFNEIKELVNNNKKVYIITPEQFSFTAEKNLMKAVGKNAVISAEVVTFERMAYRIINEEGNAGKENISDCGKAMILYNIISKNKEELNFLGKTDKNLDIILRMITELKKNIVKSDNLQNSINELDDEYLKFKLKDVSFLYNEFNKEIENKYLDDNDLLTIVKNKISKSKMFEDSYIYIDEFTGFTKQEYSVLEELLNKANEVNLTICTDSLELPINPDTDVFTANKRTIRTIKEIANKNDIKILNPIELKNIYRFKNEELNYLSDNLYNINFKPYLKECSNIKMFLANNNYSEIENVANNIIELIREKNYRYREISIITKNTEEYASLIKAIFSKYNIPVFVDEKKDLNQNILVRYIVAILDILSKSFNMESVINYIKTGFLDLEYEEIYKFENYCKKLGISGIKKFSNNWEVITDSKEDIEELNNIRIKVITPLLKLKNKLDKNKTVKEITTALYTFLEENKINKILFEKINFFEQIGKQDLANIYNSSWDILIEILDELVLVLEDEKVSFESYSNLLRVGFNNSSLGKIPATLDEVIVGDVDRTRNESKKVIFIIGLNDGKFPSINKNEGFINDEERINLKEKGIELAKTTKEQVYDENFNIYKAFSVAEEKLYLSYSASDSDGKGLRKSILINKIKKLFPKIKEESDIINTFSHITSKDITFDLLLINLRKYLNGDKIESIWFEIYSLYKNDEQYKNKLIKAVNGLSYTNIPEKINNKLLEKIYGDTFETSISKLESYRKCAFSYYLKYILKLSDRTELKVQSLDTGTFMHDVIDEFFDVINAENINIRNLDEDIINKIIEEIIDRKLLLKKNYIFNIIPKYVVLAKRLKNVIINAIKYIVSTLKNSDFNVLGTEIEFGKNKTYEPIEILLENNKKVQIIGKIDRIDIAENKDGKYIRIIDYKSSVKNIDLNEVVAGIQIQLLTYLDAVSKKEEAEPAGTLYFNLIEPVIKAKNKYLTEEQIEQEIRNNFKMNGLILGDVNVIKMMDSNLVSGNSSIIPAYIDKDGNISKNKSSILERQDFSVLQNKIEKVIKRISEEILSGIIEQRPIYILKNKRTACDYCVYKPICGFDTKIPNNTYNYIQNLNKNEILDNLKNK